MICACLERPARRIQRNQSAGGSGRLVDHARKGQPSHSRRVVNQVAFEVIGRLTVTNGGGGGQLQLKRVEPIIAHTLFKSINHLRGPVSRWKSCVRVVTPSVRLRSIGRELIRSDYRAQSLHRL